MTHPPYVFIECPAGTRRKNIFNNSTLAFQKTAPVSKPYPFHYGFILNTISGDGDGLDCFVITNARRRPRDVLAVKPLGLIEYTEDGQPDHKVLAVPIAEPSISRISKTTQRRVSLFLLHVFDHIQGKHVALGRIHSASYTLDFILRSAIAPYSVNHD